MRFENFAIRTDKTLFIVIVCLSLAVSFFVQPLVLVNGDEGVYVQYARMFERGFVPVADYEGRTPILIFLVALCSKVLGSSIFAFRLPVIFATALTAGFLFLLGRDLFSKTTGMLAGILYAFNPYVLWSNTILKSEMLTILFTVIGILIVVRALRVHRLWFIFGSGIFFGLAFLERHSGAGLFLASALYIAIHSRESLVLIVKRLFIFGCGFLAGFLPIFLWIAWHNVLRAIGFWFGVSLSLITLSADRSSTAAHGFFSYSLLRDWGLLIVEDLAPQGWILFSGLVIFLGAGIRLGLRKYIRLRNIVLFVVLGTFLGAFVEHALGVFFTQGDLRPEVFFLALITTPFVVIPLLVEGVFRGKLDSVFEKHQDSVLLLTVWLAALVVLYSFWNPTYLREFIPPLTLAAAFVLNSGRFFAAHDRRAGLIIFGIIGLYGTSLLWFANPLTGGWWWSQQSMNATADYIRAHTQENESVLSANPLPIMMADRRVFADISSFGIIHARTADDHWSGYPSPNEFYSMIEKNPPEYVIVDGRMKLHVFGPYPMFRDLVTRTYEPVVVFGKSDPRGSTEIWKRRF